MTLQEFWKQMVGLKQEVLHGKYKSRGEISEVGSKIFIRYIGDAKEVSRKIVNEFGPYLGFCLVTEKEVLEQDKLKIHRENEPIVKSCRANMLHIKRYDETFEPIPICCLGEEEDFVNLLQGDITEERKYNIFKWWFFHNVVYYSGRGSCYYVSDLRWTYISTHAPDMVKRLQAEGREFYTNAGYYEALEKINTIDACVEEQLGGMDKKALDKVVQLIKGGRVIKVVD